jgi:hypothetical protein
MLKSKRSKLAASLSAGALFMGLAATAQAGPVLEFGENSFLQIDLKGQVYLENTDYGSGSDRQGDRNDFHFQRLRLSVTGMYNETYGFKWQTCGNTGSTKGALGYSLAAQDTDWNDRDIRIIDAYGIADYSDAFHLKVGLTKIPLTRANLDDCFAPLSLDRSMFVYSAYGSSPAKFSRDLGVVAWGGFMNEKLKYFAAIMQGREGQTSVTNPLVGTDGTVQKSTNEPKSNFEYVGRIHYSFLDAEPGSGYMGTYFGTKKILTIGAAMAYEAEANYKNVNSTGTVLNQDTVDYTAYAADLMFEYPLPAGVVTLTGQYLKVDFDDAYKTNLWGGDRLASIAGVNGQKEGGYGKLAYILPFTIGAEGKLQPYVLYENWLFAHLLGVDKQRVEQYGGGVNYYIHGQNARITAEYIRTDFTTPTRLPVGVGTSTIINGVENVDTFRVMLQIMI